MDHYDDFEASYTYPSLETHSENAHLSNVLSSESLPSSPTFSASQRRWRQTLDEEPRLDQRGTGSEIRQSSGTLKPKQTNLSRKRPVVQGVELIPTSQLPDKYRSIFPFPLFNAVQSRSFHHVYEGNNNFVLSSPTGSGKTAIFELAICRLANGRPSGSFKIIYMAPIRSLCSERARDWKAKFSALSVKVEEMTGDSDGISLKTIQKADIIVTTPEKWDSMTRKWQDHQKLVQLIKLFLIDEVHILNKDRGATLEAVVSRMKSITSDIRFIALSATVPNSQDIATWLGKDGSNPGLPASREVFGEEFRPVTLEKHVRGFESKGNDFAFDSVLTKKLPGIISEYSSNKPIMVFCFTRASCKTTAEELADWWTASTESARYWPAPKRHIPAKDETLPALFSCGVAYHHAGLPQNDRVMIEQAFLEGHLSVICCTSTLAMGINLPCQMVIIKGTVTFEESSRIREFSDLEVLQMIGRAGRPQFDQSATAVIMTRKNKVETYNRMVTGQEILESRLHLNLIEHFNAEIGLGTITNMRTAKRWLSSTFMFVRMKDNPRHYQVPENPAGGDIDQRLDQICDRALSMLQENDLVTDAHEFKTTQYGDAMARYYVTFETMKGFLQLPDKAKISEILSALCQAHEFREFRLRGGEKQVFKEVNKSPSLRFPIKVDLALPAHKVSLIIQAVLGGLDTLTRSLQTRHQFLHDKSAIFQHARRLIRCIVDCQSHSGDAIALRNSLMLVRSLGAQVWDDSPLQLQQLNTIGDATARKLINADIRSIEDLELAEPERLERILSRNPPYGRKLLDQVQDFPRLRIDLRAVGQPSTKNKHAVIKIQAEFGFLNAKLPLKFRGTPIYVCTLAESADGRLLHFGRISARDLGKAQRVAFEASCVDQMVTCYAACEEIAGTLQTAQIKTVGSALAATAAGTMKMVPYTDADEYGGEELDDVDLLEDDTEFVDIEALGIDALDTPVGKTAKRAFKEEEEEDTPVGKTAKRALKEEEKQDDTLVSDHKRQAREPRPEPDVVIHKLESSPFEEDVSPLDELAQKPEGPADPPTRSELEAWLLKEFGDSVELI